MSSGPQVGAASTRANGVVKSHRRRAQNDDHVDTDSYKKRMDMIKHRLELTEKSVLYLRNVLPRVKSQKAETRNKLFDNLQLAKNASRELELMLVDVHPDVEKSLSKEENQKQVALHARLSKRTQVVIDELKNLNQLMLINMPIVPLHNTAADGSDEVQTAYLTKQELLDDDVVHEYVYEESDEEDVDGVISEVDFRQAIAEERHHRVRQISTDVTYVNDMFNDLAIMVDGQQRSFDDLDANVELTLSDSKRALKDLSDASEMQRRQRQKLCWLACVFIVILVTLVMILAIVS